MESSQYTPERTEARMRHFIPRYLVHRLRKNGSVVSVGCGTGVDVEMLRSMGYDAYGFDPGRYMHFGDRDPDTQKALRVGTAEDLPFGEQQFDYAYALEVIEHVGCRNFGVEKLPNADEQRVLFLRSCLLMVKPGGTLFVTTSNKTCPVDVGHRQKYTKFVKWTSDTFGISLSLPWSRRNPLVSFSELKRLAHAAMPNEKLKFTAATGRNYPRLSAAKNWKGAMTRTILAILDIPFLRASPLSPLLAVEIQRAN